ncbi:H/ACA ribonucleoprotein complex non-core subunit NAF1-like [Artemia franciscana]|uniref:H/ACA ribonucleoprotein complex non-core subunit NAF1-like n=1 Tax=Artemia franciscana TaxID=6661 RepID=UPI0032DB40D4
MENKLAPSAPAEQSLHKIPQKIDFSTETAEDIQAQVLNDTLHDGEHLKETNLELNKGNMLSNTDVEMTDTSKQILPSNLNSAAEITKINTQDSFDDDHEKIIEVNPDNNLKENSSAITSMKEEADEQSLIKAGLTNEDCGESANKHEKDLNTAPITNECERAVNSAEEESQSLLKITYQTDFSTENAADLQTQVLNDELSNSECCKETHLGLNTNAKLSNTDIEMSDTSQQELPSNLDSTVEITNTNTVDGKNTNITSNSKKELKSLVLSNVQEVAIESEVLNLDMKSSEIETEKNSSSEPISSIEQVLQPSIETDIQMGRQSYRDSDTSDSSEESSESSSEYEDSESSEEEVEELIIEDEEIKQTKKKLLPEEEYCPSSLPKIEDLTISVPENECLEMGKITSIIDNLVVVQALKNTPALDEDSVLFLDKGKKPLGKVFDIFGCVSEPSYVVRFNSPEHVQEKEITVGTEVFCAPRTEHSHFVLISQLMSMKGSDASGKNDMELPPSLQEFSDDEKEREARRKKKSQKHNNRIEIVYEGERPPQKRGRGRGQSTGSYRPRVSNNPFGSNYQQTSLPQREYVPRCQPPQNSTFNSQLTVRQQEGYGVNFQSVEIVGSNYQPQSRQQGRYEPKFQSLQNSGLEYQSSIRTRGGYGTRFQPPQNFNHSTEMSVSDPPRFDYFYENQQQSHMNIAPSPIHHTSSLRFQPRPPPRYPRFGATPGWSSFSSPGEAHQPQYFESYRPPRY